ncbi:MAG: hypothetical protein ABIT08_11825 [Bacteroidia bacterium]
MLILLSGACCKQHIASVQTKTEVADSSMVNLKLTEATVIDYSEVDGCKFLLELSDKEKIQPENLSPEFHKDKLKVLIKYHLTNRMTICMAGKTVHIDYIKIKKE